MAKFLHTDTEDGESIALPTKWEICDKCQGHGKSSAYLGSFTSDEMDEMGSDFEDEYFNGGYDRTCDACNGTGKVEVVDERHLKPEVRKLWEEQTRIDADFEAESRAERRAEMFFECALTGSRPDWDY